MTENMRNYMKAVSGDKEALSRFEELAKEGRDLAVREILADAEARSLPLTEEDLAPGEEIDDSELDAVAGGATCFCAVGGGGTATTQYENTCVCVVAGAGTRTDQGTRCTCPVLGEGNEISG